MYLCSNWLLSINGRFFRAYLVFVTTASDELFSSWCPFLHRECKICSMLQEKGGSKIHPVYVLGWRWGRWNVIHIYPITFKQNVIFIFWFFHSMDSSYHSIQFLTSTIYLLHFSTCLKTMYFAKVINAHLPNVRVPKLILSLSDIRHSCPTSCFHYFVSCVGYSRHKKGNCFLEFL